MTRIDQNKLLNITNSLIHKSFPELEKVSILIDFEELSDAYLMYGVVKDKKEYFIVVDPSMKKAPVKAVTGGIAHELCHIVSDLQDNSILKIFWNWLYNKNIYYQNLVERNTDTDTIIRGYGNELLILMDFSNKNADDRVFKTPYTGLTYEEIFKIKNSF